MLVCFYISFDVGGDNMQCTRLRPRVSSSPSLVFYSSFKGLISLLILKVGKYATSFFCAQVLRLEVHEDILMRCDPCQYNSTIVC